MKKNRRNDIKPDTVYHDLLLNFLLVFMVLFILAILFVKPPVETKKVDAKAEYLITLEWDDNSENDLDIWVRDPVNNIVSFRNKSAWLMFLGIDDLGLTTDFVKLPDGTEKRVPLNKEIVSLRGIVPGKYTVNVMFWSDRDHTGPVSAKVTLIRINPKYEKVLENTIYIPESGRERTAFSFVLTSKSEIISPDTLNVPIAIKNVYSDSP